ncbi:MAG: hypothetical protein GC150_09770 [Rhizobiales bacterium]|nr:hypothetical protein [Hyphomicrobiales bacterium]
MRALHPRISGLALVILLAGLGIALKTERYTGRHGGDDRVVSASVVQALDGHGWRLVHRRMRGPDQAYSFVAFAKSGCERTLGVALLGRTHELAGFARRELGPATRFVFAGGLWEELPWWAGAVSPGLGLARRLGLAGHEHTDDVLALAWQGEDGGLLTHWPMDTGGCAMPEPGELIGSTAVVGPVRAPAA